MKWTWTVQFWRTSTKLSTECLEHLCWLQCLCIRRYSACGSFSFLGSISECYLLFLYYYGHSFICTFNNVWSAFGLSNRRFHEYFAVTTVAAVNIFVRVFNDLTRRLFLLISLLLDAPLLSGFSLLKMASSNLLLESVLMSLLLIFVKLQGCKVMTDEVR